MNCWINGRKCPIGAESSECGLLSVGGSHCSGCSVNTFHQEEVRNILKETGFYFLVTEEPLIDDELQKKIVDASLILREALEFYQGELEKRIGLFKKAVEEEVCRIDDAQGKIEKITNIEFQIIKPLMIYKKTG
jgi:uncharacterized small protein (DUF1192 family)